MNFNFMCLSFVASILAVGPLSAALSPAQLESAKSILKTSQTISKDFNYFNHVLEFIGEKASNEGEANEIASSVLKLKTDESKGIAQSKREKPAQISVALVIDVSGSMGDSPRSGGMRKIEGALLSANATLNKLKDFKTSHPEKKMLVGVYTFSSGNDFRAEPGLQMQEMTKDYPALPALAIRGGTAIGEALQNAKLEVSKTKAESQNIVLITDGENTEGIQPVNVLRSLYVLPFQEIPSVYFVAFDVNSQIFSQLSPYVRGTKIYEAGTEIQLKEVLKGIVNNVLAEDEPGL